MTAVRGQSADRGGSGVRLMIGSAAILLYTLVGYPLIAGILARLKPRPVVARPGELPTVSLIIAALDESAAIDRKLENCRKLEYPPELVETIVVTDGSADDTPEKAGRHPGVVVLHDPVRRGKAAAITRAAGVAEREILVFTDANNVLAPEALLELVRPFGDPSVGCVTGRKAIDDGSGRPLDAAEGTYWRYEAAIRRWESRWGSVSSVNGELLALRRRAFTPLTSSVVTDDLVLALEAAIAGWRIAYAERALSIERASATTGAESTRRSRNIAGRWHALRHVGPRLALANPVLAWQIVSHKALRLVLPVATVGLVVGNLAAARRRAWAVPVLAAQGVFYAAATIGWSLEGRGGSGRATYLPYYFVRMNIATAAGFLRALRKSSSALARWQRVERG